MTYASVAADHAPPPSEQPQPDQSLLEGHVEGTENPHVPDGTGVTVVPADFKETLETEATHVAEELDEKAAELKKAAEEEAEKARVEAAHAKHHAEVEAEKAKKVLKKKAAEAEKGAVSIYNQVAAVVSKPKVFVPIISALNIALLGFVGYKAQAQQKSWKPADRRIVTSVAVGLGALFSLEGYGLSSYFSKRDFNGNVKTL